MATPAEFEAKGQKISFQYDGETFEVLPPAEWDVEALEAVEDQKIVTCIRLILGDEQWKRFKARPRTVGDLNALFAVMQARALGPSGN